MNYGRNENKFLNVIKKIRNDEKVNIQGTNCQVKSLHAYQQVKQLTKVVNFLIMDVTNRNQHIASEEFESLKF